MGSALILSIEVRGSNRFAEIPAALCRVVLSDGRYFYCCLNRSLQTGTSVVDNQDIPLLALCIFDTQVFLRRTSLSF